MSNAAPSRVEIALFCVQNAGIWKIAKALKQCNDINFVLLYTFHFQTFIIKKMLSKNDQNLKALFQTKANQEKREEIGKSRVKIENSGNQNLNPKI